jgi:peptide deformylase
MWDNLRILEYPDPRLRAVARPVDVFDESLRTLAAQMLLLMHSHQGVGLAAPQVGVPSRIFVTNPTGEPTDDRAFVNPELFDAEGSDEAEEGCLSLPDIRALILRSKTIRIIARDLDGKPIEETVTGFPARVIQHEFDHLNGILILTRMGPSALALHKKVLRDLEEKFARPTPPTVNPPPAKPTR